MKGTLPYLAPEIIALKAWNRNRLGAQPPPYNKSVDVWALGLILYALYTERSFNWVLFGAIPSQGSATVTSATWEAFHKDLSRRIQSTNDPETQVALRSIAKFTEWVATDRSPASGVRRAIAQIRHSQSRGTIVPKEGRKRRWQDN